MEPDDKSIIDIYLHGELEDPDLDAFERRFFIGDDLFEQIETSEMRLIDKFVRGEMDSDQQARFETGYLTSVERREKLAEAVSFHSALDESKAERKGWLGGLSSLLEFRFPVLQLSGAVAVIVVVLGAIWTVWVLQSKPQNVALGNTNSAVPPINVDLQTGSPGPVSSVKPEPPDDQEPGDQKLPSPTKESFPTPTIDVPENQIPTITSPLNEFVAVTLRNPKLAGETPVYVPVSVGERTAIVSISMTLPKNRKDESSFVVVLDPKGRRVSSLASVKPTAERIVSINIAAGKLIEGKYRVNLKPSETGSTGFVYGFEVKKKY